MKERCTDETDEINWIDKDENDEWQDWQDEINETEETKETKMMKIAGLIKINWIKKMKVKAWWWKLTKTKINKADALKEIVRRNDQTWTSQGNLKRDLWITKAPEELNYS